MLGRKKEAKRQPRPAESLAQYGLFEVPDNLDDIGGNYMDGDGNDEDLEAELAALTAGDDTSVKRNRNARKPIPQARLDAMVAESMKDLSPEDEVSDGDDDSDLLDELKMITGEESVHEETANEDAVSEEAKTQSDDDPAKQQTINLLVQRLKSLEMARENAKERNDMACAHRLSGEIKSLKETISHMRAQKNVTKYKLPPVFPASAPADPEEATAGTVSPTGVDVSKVDRDDENIENIERVQPAVVNEEVMETLKKRQQEYKMAAVAWKKAGNVQQAMQHVKISKQFDIVIASVTNGEAIDLSDMPPTPTLPSAATLSPTSELPGKEESEVQTSAPAETPPDEAEEAPSHHGAEDVEGALKERLEVYRRTKVAAESEGNSSKARRYGRICKQFEDALKLHARGRPVPLDELPVPPGFPPLSAAPQPAAPEAPKEAPKEEPQEPSEPQGPSEPAASNGESVKTTPNKKPVPAARPGIVRKPNQKVTSRAEKQMMQLQQRQHELKQAALAAKKDGDLELARDYLRQAKGLQPLIEASKGGLPVDMNSIPLSPIAKMELNEHGISGGQVDDNFTLINSDDCIEEAEGTDEQIYENLEAQLIKQVKWCLSTRDHSKALGDVPGYNRWERLAHSYSRDLDMLRVRKRDSLPPPQHHYEMKTYAIVQSCTDLNDNDIEISIIRGINYSREADTYVMFEFPFPTDSPPADRTSTVKGTNSPEYEAVFPLTGIIDRNSRQCQRSFKRHALKCQVWAKGGFFRSDSLLGTVTVKLQPLETHCTLHDCFPLMDGRKPAGGKLELKMRLRNPILTKQIEQITDKWLMIDH